MNPLTENVFKELGVSVNQEFKLKVNNIIRTCSYRLTNKLILQFKNPDGTWTTVFTDTVADIIIGRLTIVKEPLLTYDEKLLLSYFIFDFITKDSDGDLQLNSNGKMAAYIFMEDTTLKFNSILNGTVYTREDLGL